MKIKRFILLAVGLPAVVIALFFALVPVARVVVTGYLAGEQFSQGRPTSYWVAKLKDDSVEERRKASFALGYSSYKEYKEIHALKGKECDMAVTALIESLKDTDDPVRINAIHALDVLGPEDERTVPALIEMLSDVADNVRASAADALGFMKGPPNTQAIPALTRALNDRSPSVRVAAARAVWLIARDAKNTVPVLIAIVKDRSIPFGVRRDAIGSLRIIGPSAMKAATLLRPHLQGGEDGPLRKELERALGEMGFGREPGTEGIDGP